MKTTIIGFGKCGEEVLNKCSDLNDTSFFLFSDDEAPSFRYEAKSPDELVIAVYYASRSETVESTGIRRKYSVNVSLVDMGLRASEDYNGLLNVEFVVLPFRHIDMLTELHEMYADRNVIFVPEKGGGGKDESEYLSKCADSIATQIHSLKSMTDYARYDERALDISDIHSAFGYGDGTYKVINSSTGWNFDECVHSMHWYLRNYLKIWPKRIVCNIITPKELTTQQIEKLKSCADDVKFGITLATSESKSVKLSYIAAFNWSASDINLTPLAIY